MNKIRQVFLKNRVFLPVIHFKNSAEFFRSVDIAVEAGADGLFFIKQGGISMNVLDEHIEKVDSKYPKLWKGVNYLCDNFRALSRIQHSMFAKISGIWLDDGMIRENQEILIEAEQFRDKLKQSSATIKWHGLYFGGVSFKYQTSVKDNDYVARVAKEYMDVVTTSGDGTGRAAKPDKVITFRKALDDYALALASGVTPANVKSYLPYVDAYLVATGIEDEFGVLNKEKTEKLAKIIREYKLRPIA